MREKPRDNETTTREANAETESDLEVLQGKLAELVGKYARTGYISYGMGADLEENKRRTQKAEEYHDELLHLCGDALGSGRDTEKVLGIIDSIVLSYKHASGEELFPVMRKSKFYRGLILKMGEKRREDK